ncbi:MAG: DUF2971 domain-containing protein [Acetobacteraceae bacterium]
MIDAPNPLPEEFLRGIRLESVFMPFARRQRDALYNGGQKTSARFVHYTSADAALSIIKSKRIWMRNTTCMSDYREVQHGFEMLHKFFADQTQRSRLYATLDTIADNLAGEAVQLFDQWWTNIRFSTYIASVSEHDDSEDLHGRLSMWRAFGGTPARVAFVFNVPWFTGAENELNVMFSPVAYLQESEAHAQIGAVLQNVEREREFLRTVERPTLVASVFNMLATGVTCLKHEGFREEREWRAIYSPDRLPSPLMESATEVIGGIPQIIHKLPLDVRKSEKLAALDMAAMFDRLIIGPSQFAWPMYEAFSGALEAIGIADAKKRVRISGIPIRS